MLKTLRNKVSEYLWLHALETHGSRMGRIDAPPFTRYLAQARARFSGSGDLPPELEGKAVEFLERSFASFWTPTLGALASEMLAVVRAEEAVRGAALWNSDMRYTGGELYTKFPQIEEMLRHAVVPFVERVYSAHCKVFYGLMYKSERRADMRRDSQIWHSDGGPGTCINVMFTLVDTSAENGAMECLPWQDSLAIFRDERSAITRMGAIDVPSDLPPNERINYVRDAYYGRRIEADFKSRAVHVTGRAGTVIAFRNNILHRGGFVQPGHVRYACVLHLYPSIHPMRYALYRQHGIAKSRGLPKSPDFADAEIAMAAPGAAAS